MENNVNSNNSTTTNDSNNDNNNSTSMKVKNDHSSEFSNLSNWKEDA